MKPILNFQLAEQLQYFRAGHGAGKEARLPVLIYLLLRCNKHLRCWPDVATIARETGIGKPRIVEALAWLVTQRAMMYVPVAKRTGNEQKLRKNRRIYQLTGVINLNREPIEYLFLSAEEKQQLLSELARLEATEILDCWKGTLTEQTGRAIGSDSESEISSENDLERALNGSDSDNIELYPDQTPIQELNLSARDRAGTARSDAEQRDGVQARKPLPTAVLETPPGSATPSPSLFEVICQQGFKLDPHQLPIDPHTGKVLDGGRIGKIRKAALTLYPHLTATQMSAMYAAYYRALPEVQYLKSVPLTLEYLAEFMQTGTIKSPFQRGQGGKSRQANHEQTYGFGGRALDLDFQHPKNAYTAYLREDLPHLHLPTGYAEWLQVSYWARMPHTNTILGSTLVRGLTKFAGGQHEIPV